MFNLLLKGAQRASTLPLFVLFLVFAGMLSNTIAASAQCNPVCTGETYCNGTTCVSCSSSCTFGVEYELQPCTPTTDRICSPCDVCGPNEYEIVACNEGGDITVNRVCTSCSSSCTFGVEYELQPCTPTTDRVCSTCDVCGPNEYEIVACNEGGDITINRVCTPCSPTCPSGTGTNGAGGTACSSSSDRVCGTCPTGFENDGSSLVCQAVLPIELASFGVQTVGTSVVLNWVTLSETDNSHFSIERSFDGETFSPIGEVEGAGTSNLSLSYSFVDDKPYDAINYYRIQQTDFDGKSSYSPIKAIDFLDMQSVSISSILLSGNILVNTQLENYTLSISNTAGQELKKVFGLSFDQSVDVDALAAGTYYVTIQAGRVSKTMKVFKK